MTDDQRPVREINAVTLVTTDMARWRLLEGRRVRVLLRDGSDVGPCELISAGRGAVTTCWLVTGDGDLFIGHAEVRDLCDDPTAAARRPPGDPVCRLWTAA